MLQNLTFSEVIQSDFPSIRLANIDHCELSTINIENFNGSTSTSVPIIQMSTNLETYTLIQDLNHAKLIFILDSYSSDSNIS